MKSLNVNKTNIIYWSPRILSSLFIGLLSLFSLDVFAEYSGWQAVVPLLIHLIPSFILLLATIFAWKHELIGVILFFAFALLYLATVGLGHPLSWYLVIPGPAIVVSLLFLLSWLQKKKT